MHEEEINSIEELVAVPERLKTELKRRMIWYRGQASDCRLIPRLYRERAEAWEVEMNLDFQLRAPSRHPACPDKGDRAGWLSLMQHYGLPTRLLDWTESILIAAFFAVSHCPAADDSGSAIWALSPALLQECQGERETDLVLGGEPTALLVDAAFGEGVGARLIMPVRGTEIDLRMMVQQSAFTLHGSSRALEDMPCCDRFLAKLTIPAEARGTLKSQLADLGFQPHNLFPDLTHLAEFEIGIVRSKTKG